MRKFRAELLTTLEQVARIAEPWESLRAGLKWPYPEQHPDWLATEIGSKDEPDRSFFVVALYEGDALVGVAPFLTRDWKWRCRVGYKTVVSFPVRLAVICGTELVALQDAEVQEALLAEVARAPIPFQMVWLESVPTDSLLWKLTHHARANDDKFWSYAPTPSSLHHLTELPDTFDKYMSRFGGDTRRNLLRFGRKLEAKCADGMRVKRITDAADVPKFCADVELLSEVSWQGTQLQHVVKDTEQLRSAFVTRASRGWLRSYVLSNGETPIAFVVGYQDRGIFHLDRAGFDPAWGSLKAGTVLLLKVFEDLCKVDRPRWVDYRTGDAEYKRRFGTFSFEDGGAYLIRKSPYMALAKATHRSMRGVETALKRSIDRLGIRQQVKNFLRRGAAPSSTVTAPKESAE